VQNNAARIVLQAPRRCHANPLLRQLHWLPVRHRINYKLAVMTYKIHNTGLPAYLSRHINRRESTRTLRSSDILLLTVPITRTELAKRAFRCAASSVWNSLPAFIINSGSLTTFSASEMTYILSGGALNSTHSLTLTTFKSRLKTYFFRFIF